MGLVRMGKKSRRDMVEQRHIYVTLTLSHTSPCPWLKINIKAAFKYACTVCTLNLSVGLFEWIERGWEVFGPSSILVTVVYFTWPATIFHHLLESLVEVLKGLKTSKYPSPMWVLIWSGHQLYGRLGKIIACVHRGEIWPSKCNSETN